MKRRSLRFELTTRRARARPLTWSHCSSGLPMMLSVATGSTADMSAPKSSDSMGFVGSTMSVSPDFPREYVSPPTMNVDTRVPTNA